MNPVLISQELKNLKILLLFPLLGILLPASPQKNYLILENLLIITASSFLGVMLFYSSRKWLILLPFSRNHILRTRLILGFCLLLVFSLIWKTGLSLYPSTPKQIFLTFLSSGLGFWFLKMSRHYTDSPTLPFLLAWGIGMLMIR